MAIKFQDKQLSPCIVSKVKHALRLKNEEPRNSKKCSKKYWEKVVNAVASGEKNPIDEETKRRAIDSWSKYQ